MVNCKIAAVFSVASSNNYSLIFPPNSGLKGLSKWLVKIKDLIENLIAFSSYETVKSLVIGFGKNYGCKS